MLATGWTGGISSDELRHVSEDPFNREPGGLETERLPKYHERPTTIHRRPALRQPRQCPWNSSRCELLREHGAELLIHLGDIGSESVLEELLGGPARVVFGNCDDERSLAQYASILGIPSEHPGGALELSTGRLAYTHGHLPGFTKDLIEQESPTTLAHGHTHEIRDERIGDLHIINPGALFRARRYTVALLHAEEDRLEVLQVPRLG